MSNRQRVEFQRSEARNEASAQTQGLSSVDNALRLLELVCDVQALRVAEAADRLGVARSTAHRLLTALRERGYVLQDRPNGAYHPGPRLNAIGLTAITRFDIRQVARPVLEELRDETNETTTLAILESRQIRFVDSVESSRSVRVGNRTGVVRLAHACAVGKAILAAMPGAELERRYPNAELEGATPVTIRDRQVLLDELDRVRAHGYALNWEESADGVSAIAAALHDATGFPIAGLGIAAPTSRMANAESLLAFTPVLLAGAERIHGQLLDDRDRD